MLKSHRVAQPGRVRLGRKRQGDPTAHPDRSAPFTNVSGTLEVSILEVGPAKRVFAADFDAVKTVERKP